MSLILIQFGFCSGFRNDEKLDEDWILVLLDRREWNSDFWKNKAKNEELGGFGRIFRRGEL